LPLKEESKIVVVPPFAESISEGDVRWEKNVGDHVNTDETVAEVETDKTSIPIPAPASGIIEERFVEDGTTVKPGMKLFRMKVTGEAAASSESAPPPPKKEDAAPPPPPPPQEQPSAPAAAPPPPPPKAPPPPPPRPAAPKDSKPVSAVPPPAMAQPVVKVPPADFTKEISGTRSEQRVKMNRMRQRIAQRLKEAQNTNAMLTTFNEIDMSNIIEMRKQHGETFNKRHGIKIGFMSPFVKASAYALMDQPVVNAVIDGADIVYRDYVDISVAVATPKGLVVPVLRNVHSMSYLDIERGMAALAEKARDGNLAVEDMDGGTFTISNGGVFGSLYGTPIINPPQSAILGMHAIVERPVARNGQVVIRPMMYVALTYDHRLIDGREAVTFLKKIKSAVEDPRSMLMGL
jgi:2-oxoglutarate dehydrogenase E2 component (dihydrolipoamide succinyltransferase)